MLPNLFFIRRVREAVIARSVQAADGLRDVAIHCKYDDMGFPDRHAQTVRGLLARDDDFLGLPNRSILAALPAHPALQ